MQKDTESPNEKSNFLLKSKKILIEIIVIVFSVYVSIWLSNLNDYKKQQKETKEFLQDLQIDLKTDIKNINEEKSKLIESQQGITALLNLTPEQQKTLGQIQMKVRFTTRKNIEANYEGFKSSGKIGNIESRKLKTNILSYYQEYMSTTAEIERDLNIAKKEVTEILGRNSFKTTALTDPYLRTKLDIYLGLTKSLVDGYDEDLKLAKETIQEINKYLE